ncbi:MAG TPA: UDP-N-acetylmuramoyl-L-alanine--D-glutamate ligase [Lacipirellulaceae bacterium]|nr:UDP-N-acetylmuramoyl-L-alanine--D-glutamate ligase [Lacipirellulaceae bacterium]
MSFSVRGQNVTVVGAARSGIAAALLLAERGARVTLTDIRPELEARMLGRLRSAGVTVELGPHRRETLTSSDLIVLSPGVPVNEPSVAHARIAGIPIMGELELASRWVSGKIVAITGTKGKSTTTTLTGRMFDAGGLRAIVGGNIGTPLSSQVADSTPETFHIVEVSSFQLETTETFHPWVAVLLNLSSDHLDRHGSMEEYGAAKARIFANQTADDWAVINADDPQTLALARAARAKKVLFSLTTPLVPLASIRLIGRHLVADVMAAATVAQIAGVSHDAIVRAVDSFTGLEHALEPVAVVGGVRFINDSKATNIEAAKQAIEAFDGGLVVIMGGRFKSGDFASLRDPLRSRRATVVAIGEATPLIREALEDVVPVHAAVTLSEAVRRAFSLASDGGTVLLTPACASFDMFRDYAERGEAFKEEVARLVEENTTRER